MATRLREVFSGWLRPAVYLGNNRITALGAILTTSSAITLIAVWVYESIRGFGAIHPYSGLVFFLLLPGVFVIGLALIPFGAFLRWRLLRRKHELPTEYPQIDLKNPVLQRGLLLILALTLVNVLLMGVASYKGVEYMDSQKFCGQTCHSVMDPEYTAYENSPHSRVECVSCHIGPGASWFVKSKLSGVRQVFAVAFHTYDRPIPYPVRELRPAQETCEQCHWPQRFSGDKFIVRRRYGDDEKNTQMTTVLVMKIGGRTSSGAVGIHGRHIDEKEQRIVYDSTDEHRQVIPRVTYREADGKVVDYDATDVKVTPAELARGEKRRMDCVDCHNRPTHAFELPPRAVDVRIDRGLISRDLPFVKKKAVEILKSVAELPSRSAAAAKIVADLTDYYQTQYPDVFRDRRAAVESAATAVRDIYLRNVFPGMKITWGTYPNNIGHEDFPGCFRCHDGAHVTSDGRAIVADCDACHNILAQDETDPKVLAQFGIQ
jgi:nitrate/TMAO reductase-like tetraheme cytochrome c subunit